MSRSRVISLVIALALIIASLVAKQYLSTSLPGKFVQESVPVLQEPGTEHSHASIMIFLGEVPLNLGEPKYQEKSEHAHMHDNNPYFIHKHARGVTLSRFLNSLNISLTIDCLSIESTQHCVDNDNNLVVWINREPLAISPDYYEISNGDKILIDYSGSNNEELLIKSNSIPDLDEDLLQNG